MLSENSSENADTLTEKNGKKQTKIAGIPFDKQISRANFEKNPKTADFLLSSTSYDCITKKTKVLDMKKTLPRPDLYKIPEFALEYNPRKELILPLLVKNISFEKMPNRKSLFFNEKTPEPYDVNYNAIEKKTKVVDFSKTLSRYFNEESVVPSYMQSVHSRNSLAFKSLREFDSVVEEKFEGFNHNGSIIVDSSYKN